MLVMGAEVLSRFRALCVDGKHQEKRRESAHARCDVGIDFKHSSNGMGSVARSPQTTHILIPIFTCNSTYGMGYRPITSTKKTDVSYARKR